MQNPKGRRASNKPQAGVESPVPLFMTESQIAVRLNISHRTLQMWRLKGGGPKFHKMGSAVRYRWEDVEAWLADQERTNTAQTGPQAA